MKYHVSIGCRKAGAIGSMYVIKRNFIIESDDRGTVNELAINRAYQDGDIEHVRVEHVAREVEAYDLELYAINTGQFYQWHKANANRPASVWLQHVERTVTPRYSREVEPVFATPETMQTVATSLKSYYEQHNRESAQ